MRKHRKKFNMKNTKELRDFPQGFGSIDDHNWIKETFEQELDNHDFSSHITQIVGEVEPIEHKRRDGFIPHSWNRGGFERTQFHDQSAMWGSGDSYSGELGKELQLAIQASMDMARETFVEQNPEVLFQGLTEDQINYHDLYKAGLSRYAEMLSEYEMECLRGDYSSIMERVRIMYHGQKDGKHHATVFSFVSIHDAPYHRDSEGFVEEAIEFKNKKELLNVLPQALSKVTELFS